MKTNKIIIVTIVSLIFFSSVLLTNVNAVSDKTSKEVKSRMLTNEKIPIIVMLKDKSSFQTLSKENGISVSKDISENSQHNIAFLLNDEKKRDKADEIKQFWIVNAIAVNATPELIEQLSTRDDVKSIEIDSQMHMIEEYSTHVSQGQIDRATSEIKRINATKAWELGMDGTGINVSVIDTGIYATHPDISGRVIKWIDYINSSQILPYDDNGHGTHVAGTVGGNGAGGMTTGVAPNVSLFVAKVLNYHGDGDSSDVISAIEWSVLNKADIISLSLGGGRDLVMKETINNAISAGVTVIAAAGNSGPGAGTISYPAGEKNVIAVGAVDSLDNIRSFSSRGPITVDGEELIKPDVSAPGVCINSLSNSEGYAYCWSGTSMATPHVSGTVALILQAARKNGSNLSPAQIKNILETAIIDLGITGKDKTFGAGRINVFAAIAPSIIANPTGYQGSLAAKNGSRIVINASIHDAIAGVRNASVNVSSINPSLNNISLLNVSGLWINDTLIVRALDGIYNLNMTAYNHMGYVNNFVQLSVMIDNTPPIVQINPISYDGVTASRTGGIIEFNVSVEDPTVNSVSSGAKNASVNISMINTTGIIELTNELEFWKARCTVDKTLVDGIYFLNVTFFDNAGNMNNTSQANVSIDNTPPFITINPIFYQRGTGAKTGNFIQFNFTAEDPIINGTSSGLKNASVNVSQINNTGKIELTNNSGFWKGNVTFDKTLIDGNYSLNVSFSDNSGNINNSMQINISIDNTPPLVNELSVSSTFLNLTDSINITANITSSDMVSQVNQSELFARVTYPNGTSIDYNLSNGGGSLFTKNFTDTAQYGRYNVTILANDTTGNTNSSRRTQFVTTYMTNQLVVTGANTETLTVAPYSNTTVRMFTNNSSIGMINISRSKVNLTSNALEVTNPDIYIFVNASPGIMNNLSYVILRVYYTDSDVSSYVESSLRLNRWNISSSDWDKLSGAGSYPYVNDAGVDTVNNFVWANLTGLSEFAVTGDIYVAPTPQSPGGSGGGGGGGGGSSGENYSNIQVTEKHDLAIYKDKVTSYRFTTNSSPIMFVNITGNVSFGEISTSLEVLWNTSTMVKKDPPGIMYKNANIWVGSSSFNSPRNIKHGAIRFRVKNSWIEDNKIETVMMVKWNKNEWEYLQTNEILKDDEFTYYDAFAQLFSNFAITGTKDRTTTEKITTILETRSVTLAKEPAQRVTPMIEHTKKNPGFGSIMAILGLWGV